MKNWIRTRFQRARLVGIIFLITITIPAFFDPTILILHGCIAILAALVGIGYWIDNGASE